MAERGAPKGNKNAAKPRLWEGAVRRSLAKDREALYVIADKVVELAKDGVPWAVTELRNTLDGKPKESVAITVEEVERTEVETLRRAIRRSDPESRSDTGPVATH